MNEFSINKRKNKIAFFGESVANGFLFAPHFTPSQYLENMLRKGTKHDLEVIDKTQVSIRMNELEDQFNDENVSDTDVVIIFAGNNWRKDFWNIEDENWDRFREEMTKAEIWGEIFLDEFKGWSNKKVLDFFEKIKMRFLNRNIPVIFVIPEVNLRDWRCSNYETTINWPQKTANKIQKIKDTLNEEDDEKGIESAKKLIQLAPTNPLGYFWLAKYYDRHGQPSEAYEYYKKVYNTNIYRLGPPPAINDYIRESIIKAAEGSGISLLDLREKFNNPDHGEIAGNNYFIDYCHLNIKGIMKVCECIASEITTVMNWEMETDLNPDEYLPNKEVVSNAYFYAAIHSAHSGNLDQEYLKYLLREAMEEDVSIADKMIKFSRLASMKVPWRLNKQYLDINSKQYPTIRQPKDCMVLDIELVQSIISVLKEYSIDIENEIEEIRIREHAVESDGSIDLLETYYKESSYFNTFIDSKSTDYDSSNLAYSTFRMPSSSFNFIARGSNDLVCEITSRAPNIKSYESFMIFCNQNLVFKENIGENWEKHSFSIDKRNLSDNKINTLTIVWPTLNLHINKMEDEISVRSFSYYEKVINRMRPVYGEVFDMCVSVR